MRKDEFMIKDHMPMADAFNSGKSKPAFRGVFFENMGKDDKGRDILRPISDNTVVVGGAVLALEHLADVSASKFIPATLNSILDINPDVADTSGKRPTFCLFALGTGGATLDFGSITAKDIKSRNIPEIVPLRAGTTLTGDDASLYYMKKVNENADGYLWYAKEFSAAPVIETHWKDSADEDADGTEVTGEIYDSDRTEEIETFVQIKLSLNTHDIREYFESIGNLDFARYNTLGIYTGNKVVLPDGSTDYVNVRLFAYTNFNNRDLSQKTEAEYTYRIYSLV